MQKVCIIVPCYNEAKRLKLAAFHDFLLHQEQIDILFSNDGSTDETGEILEKFVKEHQGRSTLFSLEQNSGKAEAVRQGMNEAFKKNSYAYVGFWDADLATPLEEVMHFLGYLNHDNKKIAIGSRIKRLGSTVSRKRSRHLLGRVFSTFASLILKLPVYDTQCGAKIFSSELSFLFEEEFITSWLFDIELLARFRNKYGIKNTLNEIVEVPVRVWEEVGGSKLKLKHLLKVPMELMAINRKYN